MNTTQPEALRLANILRGIDARSLFANEKLSAASAALENQHTRITELEAQLAQRFDAEDMATAVAGPDDIDAIALTRYKVVPSHDGMFHRFAVVAGDGKQQLYLGRETECQNMARKFAGAFLDGTFYQSQIASAPTPAAQAADSVRAVEREQERIAFKDAHRHLELYEVPDAWGRPMFKHSHVEASWLGWIARTSHGQAPADLSPTAGMNIAQRILHVGGRNNDAGYVEFGSIQAVEALVRQVLRDLPAPATQQPEGDVVAYLDVGASGYLDLGAALSEDALQQLPKGRHALVIAGTYGIDGYVAAPQPSHMAQAVPATQQAGEVSESIEQLAVARYKVVPAHESMFHRWAVVAGDGAQQLYIGREVECENMTRKFAGAFLDGAFLALQNATPQPSHHWLATHGQAPAGAAPECLTCSDHGAVGNILTAEPCPDCTRWNVQPARAPADSVQEDAARYRHLRDCNSGSLAVMQITGTDEDDWFILTEDDADAAIDAARKQGATQ